jgi:hypothetical protein
MTEVYSLSWTAGQAAARLRTYRILFGISIATNVVVCLMALLIPYRFAHLLGQPDPFPDGWPRVWGATLLGLHLVYVPGLLQPLRYRWPNWASIVIKFWMVIVFLFQGWLFLPFAVWDFAWGVVLLVAYYRLTLADTARRP